MKQRRGFALIAALWFAVLLSGVALEFALAARDLRTSTLNARDRAAARAAAEAGVELPVGVMLLGDDAAELAHAVAEHRPVREQAGSLLEEEHPDLAWRRRSASLAVARALGAAGHLESADDSPQPIAQLGEVSRPDQHMPCGEHEDDPEGDKDGRRRAQEECALDRELGERSCSNPHRVPDLTAKGAVRA